MNDSIEISESLPVKDTPSSEATILIPVRMGIVVLDETALERLVHFRLNDLLNRKFHVYPPNG